MTRIDNTKNNIFGNDYVEANEMPSKISNISQRIQDKNQALI